MVLLMTYLTDYLSLIFRHKLRVFHLVRKFPTRYGNRMLITVFETACNFLKKN